MDGIDVVVAKHKFSYDLMNKRCSYWYGMALLFERECRQTGELYKEDFGFVKDNVVAWGTRLSEKLVK